MTWFQQYISIALEISSYTYLLHGGRNLIYWVPNDDPTFRILCHRKKRKQHCRMQHSRWRALALLLLTGLLVEFHPPLSIQTILYNPRSHNTWTKDLNERTWKRAKIYQCPRNTNSYNQRNKEIFVEFLMTWQYMCHFLIEPPSMLLIEQADVTSMMWIIWYISHGLITLVHIGHIFLFISLELV